MRVLITGAYGQLGKALVRNRNDKFSLMLPDRKDLDLSNEESCKSFIKNNKPDWIINAGAYTNVEMAEKNNNEAYLVNTKAVEIFVEEISSYNGNILQVSTDYVFNGNFSRPINPLSNVGPLNYYGYTKSEAEKIVLNYKNSKIIRTSWLYGPVGKNFFLTIFKLLKNKEINTPINIVYDQIGCPTSTDSLSNACWVSLEKNNSPDILQWTDLGSSSWYDFAYNIKIILQNRNLIERPRQIEPISSDEFLTQAKRPYYSILDCGETYKSLNLKANHWTFELNRVVNQFIKGKESI
tara:strand:+ start:130 stop:1014 length:885 start_codon:yes stop_codon:yes gene_type:complete